MIPSTVIHPSIKSPKKHLRNSYHQETMLKVVVDGRISKPQFLPLRDLESSGKEKKIHNARQTALEEQRKEMFKLESRMVKL